ncbi:MAG TPA: TIGR00159 family protein [Lachnospiraceae bacterium]|uniref:diadenylate cyclase CdaA n=1 Tax=Anaerosporobacter sp. TaxID=1872529 RepID=UPI000ECD0267|nr:diadenylate cyclase CdaA [Anaerosporobacter sp.]MBS5934599.1 diadenylate cyclase CdaA [Clostridiales bacterium]HAB60308.1 TIGR00159 family protein [Lachnospiraceae bacterium]
METIKSFVNDYLVWLSIPKLTLTDILEILILAFLIYHIVNWIKSTRAWMLVKGIIVLCIFSLIASILNFNVILWIISKTINVGIIAVVILFQPELRKALEQLGRKNIVSSFITFDDQKEKNERFSDKTISEIVRATFELSKTKTGALMVIEQNIILSEYERTGINIDSAISSQLLINIFEHNTPLHDGAVLIRGNRIVAATCYLPLSDNMELSKDLGTRHRAGVGISEVSDSLTITVSEETGKVSIAIGGVLIRNVDGDYLKNKLQSLQRRSGETKKIKLWRGRLKNEKKMD